MIFSLTSITTSLDHFRYPQWTLQHSSAPFPVPLCPPTQGTAHLLSISMHLPLLDFLYIQNWASLCLSSLAPFHFVSTMFSRLVHTAAYVSSAHSFLSKHSLSLPPTLPYHSPAFPISVYRVRLIFLAFLDVRQREPGSGFRFT